MYTIKLINSGWSIEIKRPSDRSYYKILQLIMTELKHWGNPVKDVPDNMNNTVYDLTNQFTLKEFHEFCKSLKEVVTPIYGFIQELKSNKYCEIREHSNSIIISLPKFEIRITNTEIQVFCTNLDFASKMIPELRDEKDNLIYWFNNMR